MVWNDKEAFDKVHICSLGRKEECNIRILSSLPLGPQSRLTYTMDSSQRSLSVGGASLPLSWCSSPLLFLATVGAEPGRQVFSLLSRAMNLGVWIGIRRLAWDAVTGEWVTPDSLVNMFPRYETQTPCKVALKKEFVLRSGQLINDQWTIWGLERLLSTSNSCYANLRTWVQISSTHVKCHSCTCLSPGTMENIGKRTVEAADGWLQVQGEILSKEN